MKNTIIILIVVLLAVGGYLLLKNSNQDTNPNNEVDIVTQENPDVTNPNEVAKPEEKKQTLLGTSVEGKQIHAYHFGKGDKEVLFVGGLHGGYSWNTSLLMFELIEHLEKNSEIIPENVKVTVIPVMNPDGLQAVTGVDGKFKATDISATTQELTDARFNSNNVDLNRNFDCEWQAKGIWRSKAVSGGSQAFSEPETQALKNYVEGANPDAVVIWYSSVGGVYASNCKNGVLTETSDLTKEFAKASGYPAYEDFNFYEVTGDAVNWLAKINIPAISVLLTNHTDTEFDKNLNGIEAVLEYYAK